MKSVNRNSKVVSTEVMEIFGEFYVTLTDEYGWASTKVAHTEDEIKHIINNNPYLVYTAAVDVDGDFDDMQANPAYASVYHGAKKRNKGLL